MVFQWLRKRARQPITSRRGSLPPRRKAIALRLEELEPRVLMDATDVRAVTRLYDDLLQRPVDPVGLAFWGDRLEQGAVRWRASMRKTILQAMEAGHLRPDTDPEQLVYEIYSLIVGLVHDVRFLRDANAPRHMQRAFNRLISTYKSFNEV